MHNYVKGVLTIKALTFVAVSVHVVPSHSLHETEEYQHGINIASPSASTTTTAEAKATAVTTVARHPAQSSEVVPIEEHEINPLHPRITFHSFLIRVKIFEANT
jgi:hypothetical protein